MDRARQKTNKVLQDLERRIKRVYAESPALRRIQRTYEKYMEHVDELTLDLYKAYTNASQGDERDILKKAYVDEVKNLTLNNKQYRTIVAEFTRIMAEVNQQALDLVNSEMINIYTTNYNQLAVDCRKVGIRVEQ